MKHYEASKCTYCLLILIRLLTLLTTKSIQILQELRLQNKLIPLIKMTLQNTQASVKIRNLTSKAFSVSSAVRQGDPLLAAVFNLVLDGVIKKLNLRRDISWKLKQTVAYADDVALLARSPEALIEILRKLQNEANPSRAKYWRRQTKYRKIKRRGTKDTTHLKIDNFCL
jgi:hypothetical protein